MKIYCREAVDEVTIEGYVNAVERNSKPLYERGIRFIERIASGAFQRAIKRASSIKALLNHDKTHEIGNTTDDSLELVEDNIGLRFKLTTNDPETVRDAKAGNLVGCSFGFREIPGETSQMIDPETGLPLKKINNLELIEISLLNRKHTPAYQGTLVEVREGGEEVETSIFYSETREEEVEVIRMIGEEKEELPEEKSESPEEAEQIKEASQVTEVTSDYYASYKNMIADMRK